MDAAEVAESLRAMSRKYFPGCSEWCGELSRVLGTGVEFEAMSAILADLIDGGSEAAR